MVAQDGKAHGMLGSPNKCEIATSASSAKISFSSLTYAAEEGKGKAAP
jgi:hypothetical protein